MNEPVLSLTGVGKVFRQAGRELAVLTDVHMTVERGACVAIVGPSGAGKSTLLHLACGLLRPTSGSVAVAGQMLSGLPDAELCRLRNAQVGFIFQLHHLLPEFSALENVMLPALLAGQIRAEAAAKAEGLLDQVGLSDRAKHRPGELSGGEQQRVAIARALINEPSLLLADEPSGDLDAGTAEGIHELLLRVNRGGGQTPVMVTHNPDLSKLAGRVVHIKGGRIEAGGES
jgi:lipoprotein-releasing system ATP-binding protein